MGQCPQCGATVSPEHAKCASCGTDLIEAEAAQAVAAAAAAAAVAASISDDEAGTAPVATRDDDGGPSEIAPGEANQPVGPDAAQSALAEERTASASPARSGGRSRRGRDSGVSVVIPVLTALVVSVVMQQAITSLVSPDAYVYRLFRPSGGVVMAVVPGLIAFLLVWTLTELALKFRVGGAYERDLRRHEITQIPVLVRQEASHMTLQRLRGWDAGLLSRPVGRRVHWVLHHMNTDSDGAHLLLRHQSDLDADAAVAGYRTVKLFIWAMPILGFIGTVLGISLAVGGFSDFLTTNVSIDQVDEVTAQLGEVASGLSFAFDTTLLGLLGGLIASVASSGVQAREERGLTRLDELGLRILASSMPVSATPSAGTSVTAKPAPSEEFDDMMRERLEELAWQMNAFTGSVQGGLDGFLEEWAKLPPEIERVNADLTGLRRHLATAATSTDQLVTETRLLLEGLNEAASRMGNGLAASIGSVHKTVDGLGVSVKQVSDTLSSRMAGMEDANERLARALAASAAEVVAASERLHAGIEAQGSSEVAMQQLSDSIRDFGDRLSQIRDTQDALAPVLTQLAGPLELRLVQPSAPAPSAPTPPKGDR